jgi:hypothetical protein
VVLRESAGRVHLSKLQDLKVDLSNGLTEEMSMDDTSLTLMQASAEVEVVEAREAWSEYRLADGTVLRIKPVMLAVSRIGDAASANGEPVYETKSTLVTDVRVASSTSTPR